MPTYVLGLFQTTLNFCNIIVSSFTLTLMIKVSTILVSLHLGVAENIAPVGGPGSEVIVEGIPP